MDQRELDDFIAFVKRHEHDQWVMLTPAFARRLAQALQQRRAYTADTGFRAVPLYTAARNSDTPKS